MNPLTKLNIYRQSGGWRETFKYVFKGVISLVYTRSQTDFFLYERNDRSLADIPVKPTPVTFRRYSQENSDELFQLEFPRLFCHSVRKWLENGSRIYIGFLDKKPISYTVCHEKTYTLHGLGVIRLEDAQGWIGPVFVDISARKQGINKKQILFLMQSELKCSSFLTSANSFNQASCNTFLGIGFHRLAVVKYKKFFAARQTTSLQYLDESMKKMTIVAKTEIEKNRP